MRLPIRTRLTLIFAGLMVAVMAIVGVLFHERFAAQLDGAIDDQLGALAEELAADLAAGETDVLIEFGAGDEEGFFAQILDADGIVLESADIEAVPLVAPAASWREAAPCPFDRLVRQEHDVDATPARLCVTDAVGDRFVVIGTSLVNRNAVLGN
ncbi:MAG: hypothetical protein ACREER_12265, partial [Alphaproteobacteria bacterium]